MLKILRKLEDTERPLLGPNIKALKFWGLILPRNSRFRYFYVLMHFLIILFTLTTWIDVWFLKSDMDLLLINLKATMLATVSVFKVATFLLWHKKWGSILEYVIRSDLNQRTTTDITKIKIINASTSYCRKLTYSYWSLFAVAYVISILQPAFYFSSPSFRASVKNGTESYLQIVSSWMPFDKNTIPGYLAASAYQMFSSGYGGGLLTSYDTTAVVIMVFFRVEFELLRVDCAAIFGDDEKIADHVIVMERFKECHKRHIELIKYCRLFDSCLASINLLYTFVCSVMLCVTVYQVTIQTSLTESALLTVFLLFAVAQLFLYCWHSNAVLYASQNLVLGPYESAWYSQDVKYRRILHILMGQFRKTIVFSVGSFAKLNIATFINILKGAYSYYSFINESK